MILGDTWFIDLEEYELQKAKLLAKPTQKLAVRTNLTFNGCVISLREDGSITLQQKGQSKKIELVKNFQQY